MAKAKKQPIPPEYDTVVSTARARFRRSKDFYGDQRVLAIDDVQFVMGDSSNKWQWPDAVYRDRAQVNKKPCLTINATAQHCNQVINAIRQNRPSAKILPVDGGADKKTADILGGMLRSIQAINSADTAHDLAATFATYGGEGYWRILTDYSSFDSFDQEILIKPITNPNLVYIDPDAKEPDRSDAKWGFVFEEISREQCEEEGLDCTSWAEDGDGWCGKDMIRRAEYFWCEDKEETLYQLDNGEIVLQSDLPDEVTIQGDMLITSLGSFQIVNTRTTKKTQWKWGKLVGGEKEPVDTRDWPGQYLPIITVVGVELNVNGTMIRKGLVRDLKDPARMVNYSYSAAVEALALQNKVPYMAAVEAIEGYEDIYGAANLENRAFLPYNAFMEGPNGPMPVPKPEKQNPQQMATAQVQMLQLSTEEMRAASGQQNANFGIKSEAQSGVGIQRLKAQGEIATFHFPDNLARSLKYEAKVILDLIPKVYDTKRVVRILGLDGNEDKAMLDPEMAKAHMVQTNQEIKQAFNPLVGKYDVAIDTGPSYQTQRQEAADQLGSLVKSYPAIMQVAGDQVIRTLDLPGGIGDKIAARIEKSLPPNLQDDDADDMQKMKQQLAGLKQHADQANHIIETMDQHITQLEQEKQAKTLELASKERIETGKRITESEKTRDQATLQDYTNETDRLKVVQPVMNPEALRPIIMQLLSEMLAQPASDFSQMVTPVQPQPVEQAPVTETLSGPAAQPSL